MLVCASVLMLFGCVWLKNSIYYIVAIALTKAMESTKWITKTRLRRL